MRAPQLSTCLRDDQTQTVEQFYDNPLKFDLRSGEILM